MMNSYVAPHAADPHMSGDERTQALNWLAESHQEFLAAMDGVSDAQWSWKPGRERWSVGETAEHIVLAEGAIFDFARRAVAAAPNPAWDEQTRGKTEVIIDMMLSRQGKAVAPDPLIPRQRVTRAEVKERFERQRADLVQFAAETRAALKQHTAPHPFPAFGTLNAHQWLVLAPLHTIRHNRQMAEVKAAAGYPAN